MYGCTHFGKYFYDSICPTTYNKFMDRYPTKKVK